MLKLLENTLPRIYISKFSREHASRPPRKEDLAALHGTQPPIICDQPLTLNSIESSGFGIIFLFSLNVSSNSLKVDGASVSEFFNTFMLEPDC